MSELIAIAYPDVNRAEEVLTTLSQLRQAYLIDLEDACYVTKDAHGKVKLHQALPTTRIGVAGGALFGGITGLVLGAFVLMPLAGAAIGASLGAGTGGLVGHWSDYGIDDTFIKQLGAALQPNTSAIIVLVQSTTPDRVLSEVSKYGGTVLRTSLSKEHEAKLQAALRQGVAAQIGGETTPGTENTV
jgi:uncharacterized membrane protein